MSELTSLVREFGTFFIILALIAAVVSCVKAIVNRHRPIIHCDHDCCDDPHEDDAGEDEEE